MSKTLEVIVSRTGEVQIEAKGFSGPECVEATKEMERALGTVVKERKTADFVRTKAKQGQGA